MSRTFVALAALLAVACHEQVPPTGPTTTVVTTVVTNGGPGSGPTTPTNPTPTTPTPGGSYLPLPAYGQSVVSAYAATPAGQLALSRSCYLTVGAVASWTFIDAVVDQLRAVDPRWGYVCYRGSCSQPSQDAVAYYAGTGTPTSGALGIWDVTVIASYCTSSASVTWLPLYQPSGAWTTRGRF